MTERYLTAISSPIGTVEMVIVGDSLEVLDFCDADGRVDALIARRYPEGLRRVDSDPSGIAGKISAYFEGELDAIDRVSARPCGTPFQQTVWKALRTIPLRIHHCLQRTRREGRESAGPAGSGTGQWPQPGFHRRALSPRHRRRRIVDRLWWRDRAQGMVAAPRGHHRREPGRTVRAT